MKHKVLSCIALILLVGASVFSIVSLIRADSQPVLSVVLSGSTTTGSIPVVSVGSAFSVDVRVDNTGSISPGINGASYTVTWDPTVLSLNPDTGYAEGSTFWGNKMQDLGQLTNDVPNGKITFGQIVMDTAHPLAVAPGSAAGGVLATLTFTVLKDSESAIGLQPSDGGVAYLNYPTLDSQGKMVKNPITTSVNNAVYDESASNPSPSPSTSPTSTPTPTPSPSAHGPTAVIGLQNGTGVGVGSQVLLDGSASTGGYDNQVCPITNYAWMLQYQNNSIFEVLSGPSVTVTAPNPCILKITLIVTATDTNSPPSPSYTNTSSSTILINVLSSQQVTSIDLFTNKGGVGSNTTSPGYVPDELVKLYANVTFNGGPVPNKLVTFTILNPNSTVISTRVVITNSSGIAYQEYRTPDPTNGTTFFGNWTVLASVEVSQVIMSDTVSYSYGYPVIITANGITLPAAVNRGSSMPINIKLQTLDNSVSWSTLSITIYDNASVPITTQIIKSSTITGNTVSTTVTLPTWAFVGTAYVYVNVLTGDPTGGGLPVCPEQFANFQILT